MSGVLTRCTELSARLTKISLYRPYKNVCIGHTNVFMYVAYIVYSYTIHMYSSHVSMDHVVFTVYVVILAFLCCIDQALSVERYVYMRNV